MKLRARFSTWDWTVTALAAVPWLVFLLFILPASGALVGCGGMIWLFRWLFILGCLGLGAAVAALGRMFYSGIILNHLPPIVLGLSFAALVFLLTR